MLKLTVEGFGQFYVPQGKRLVLALEKDAGIDQLHACGGHARCTTCRVEFIGGEPDRMTVAERDVLAARGLTGVRLSWFGSGDQPPGWQRAEGRWWAACCGDRAGGGVGG